MKKTVIALSGVLLCLMLAGCSFWLQDTYISVKPYHVQEAGKEYEVITAKSYMDIRYALEGMVTDCVKSAIIAVPDFDEKTVDYYMSVATNYIIKNNAICAYAVDQISYEIGTSGGEMAIAVDIAYNYSRNTILRLKRVEDAGAAVEEMEAALQQYETEITLVISDYRETDFLQLAQDYVDENPQLCVEMPQLNVTLYPESGKERVLVLSFTYWNSREVLRSMQNNVQEAFSQLKVTGDTAQLKAVGLYNYLMSQHDYKVETSITPSYSLLRHGVGDSKAFATIYAAMCRQIGVDCRVVSGARGGEAWHWNVIRDGEEVYYVDILRCMDNGTFALLQESQMKGYVWDYSAYRK